MLTNNPHLKAFCWFCGILFPVTPTPGIDFESLYNRFNHPITEIDCGEKCSPYNDNRRPFCCDISQTVPTAFMEEWEYLKNNTILWSSWQSGTPESRNNLGDIIPEHQIPVECLGHHHCQRQFRTITCRAFPFYPYFSEENKFIGFSYYWQYEDRCWVINNLHRVTDQYREQFIAVYNDIFLAYPSEKDSFRYQTKIHRQIFTKRRTRIPLFHVDGKDYLVTPQNGQLNVASFSKLPLHGAYKIAARMPFPDERENE